MPTIWIKSEIKKIILIYASIIIALPLIILLMIEILFNLFFQISGLKYFENSVETNIRTGSKSAFEIFKLESTGNSKINPIKIGVFGGSSSAGYASPLSFSNIIGNNDFTGKNLEVHNYARNGAPFVGFQAEIVKEVMQKYDVLIVYAGHNEIHQQVYSRARKSEKPIIQPNGNIIPPGSGPYENLDKILKCIKANQSTHLCTDGNNLIQWMIDRSRIFNLFNRLLHKVNLANKFNQSKISPRFYYKNTFITPFERTLISEQFKLEIQEIVNKLRDDQLLILSTVLSNDLFPPIADILPEVNNIESNEIEEIANKTYTSLIEKDYEKMKFLSNELPTGAHKTYLDAMLCLGYNGFTSIDSKNCIIKAENARRLDKLPYRVVPEINEFIRKYNNSKVIVIDPVKVFESRVFSSDDYNSYFVDFQHPSVKGHFVIANEIMMVLFNDYKSLLKNFKNDECGNIDFVEMVIKKQIKPNSNHASSQLAVNIQWLDKFMETQPLTYPYDYFKKRAQTSMELCGFIP